VIQLRDSSWHFKGPSQTQAETHLTAFRWKKNLGPEFFALSDQIRASLCAASTYSNHRQEKACMLSREIRMAASYRRSMLLGPLLGLSDRKKILRTTSHVRQ